MSRVIPNRCWRTRAGIEGKAYRIVSFVYDHPSATSEDNWTLFKHDGPPVLVDKVTLGVMGECQCEFLTREEDTDSEEPTIVAVRLEPVLKK